MFQNFLESLTKIYFPGPGSGFWLSAYLSILDRCLVVGIGTGTANGVIGGKGGILIGVCGDIFIGVSGGTIGVGGVILLISFNT